MDGRIQYNCHALLSAFLKHRAHELWPLATVHAHCLHHARCCVDKGDIDAAINLYVLVADWQAATQLIEQNAPQLMRAGKTATLLEWIRRIPITAAAELPSLAYWEGIAHLLFQPAHAIICLQTAHAGHVAQERLFEALLDVCALLDAYFALWENWQDARVWVDELARLYDLFEGKFPSADLEVRALSSGNSLLFIYLGHPLIQRWLERSETLLRNSPSPQHHVQLSTMLIVYAWWTGEMVKMREIAHIAHHSLAASQSNLLAEFRLSILIGSAVYSDGHVVDPPLRGYFERTLQMAHEQGMHLFDFQVWCLKSMEATVLYDTTTGAAALQKARALNPGKRGALPLLTMSEVAQRLLERDWNGAVELAQQRLQLSPDFGGWDFGRHLVDLALAHALCMQGKYAQACGHLVATREAVRQLPTLYIQRLDMRFGYIHAAAAYAEGDSARGDAELRKSLAMARAQGYRHIHPWWSPPLHAPLLARALEMDIESAWVTQLIKQQRIKSPAVDVHAWPYPIRLHVLGRFSVSVQGEPLPQQGKAQRKVLELLKVLAAQGGRAVAVETLADILWPDSDGADALAALDVNLHRARKLLQESSALLLHDGRVSFNSDIVWLDLASLGQTGARLSQALGEKPLTATDLSGWIEKLVRSYPAPVLANEADAPWCLRYAPHGGYASNAVRDN